MSQENVEVVRRSNEALENGDISAAMKAVDPELVTHRVYPDGRTFHGREGFLDAVADWVESFAEYGFTAEQYLDAGDRVLVRFRQWGRGETSSIAVEGPRLGPLHAFRGQDHAPGYLQRRGPGPRSRRAVGVGAAGSATRL